MNDQTLDELKQTQEVKEVMDSTIILSNIVDVTVGVIKSCSGENIASNIKENNLTSNVLSLIVINKLKDKIVNQGAM